VEIKSLILEGFKWGMILSLSVGFIAKSLNYGLKLLKRV